MSKHANLPYHLYVNVDNKYLGPNMPEGTTQGIIHAVYGREYQVLLFHVMLESGAHWSGLPLQAVSFTNDFSIDHDKLMPWKVMGEDIDVVHFHYLEGLGVETKSGAGRHTGIIIDWKDGYSRYQHEHKPLNMVALDSGQIALMPNNYCVFTDKHFTNPEAKENLKHYKRGEILYWE